MTRKKRETGIAYIACLLGDDQLVSVPLDEKGRIENASKDAKPRDIFEKFRESFEFASSRFENPQKVHDLLKERQADLSLDKYWSSDQCGQDFDRYLEDPSSGKE